MDRLCIVQVSKHFAESLEFGNLRICWMHYNLEEAGHVLWDWIIKKGCGNDWLVKVRGGAK